MNRSIFLLLILFISINLLAESNNFLWELALPGQVLDSPLERKSGEVILICEDRRLYSLNSESGEVNWNAKPGGRLQSLDISTDGSIIVTDQYNLYSYYSNGELRWELNFTHGFDSNISINDRGDIIFISGNDMYIVNRFSNNYKIIDGINSSSVASLSNSLITYVSKNEMFALSYSGKPAWNKILSGTPLFIESSDDELYLIYKNGLVELYNLSGALLKSWNSTNSNIHKVYTNYNGNLVILGDQGATIITDSTFNINDDSVETGLYYSNGTLIQSNSDWSIHGVKIDRGADYYPSGEIQTYERTISLSHKYVWGEDYKNEIHTDIILGGNRSLQLKLLKEVETNINSKTLLDSYPNFYNILLLSSSTQNINEDVREEAYKLMGLSKDISFIPYLLNDLQFEKSYSVIPYIYYALSNIGVDRNGGVIGVINSRIDDFYDEKLVINGLYALYNINNYTNGEYVDQVFNGIEKILNGGYSRVVQNQCYEILRKLK